MTAKIDERGLLHIRRKGIFKLQLCPVAEDDSACGDWCPRFVEDTYDEGDPFVLIFSEQIDVEFDEREENQSAK